MQLGFPEIVLVVGVLLLLTAALSGLAHGTVLSISAVSVLAGVGMNLAGVIDIRPDDAGVVAVVELALIFTLFSDGLIVERELLVGHRGPTARALIFAMPVTAGLIGIAAKLLFPELDWLEALLLGAVLAPTDPVITSSVVGSEGLPAKLRHTLNLESGLNDGLALPFVLVLIGLAAHEGSAGTEAAKLTGEAASGVIIGIAVAVGAARALKEIPSLTVTEKYEGVYALGIGLAAFGLAEVTFGNGLVATFVAGITVGVTEHDMEGTFREFNESLSAVLQAVTLFIFGSLVVASGVPSPAIAAVGLIAFTLFIARPVAILAAMSGSELPSVQRRFIAWFGPKGVASTLFALFVLKSEVPQAELIFQLAAVVILASVLAHGLTDTVGARWMDNRLRADSDEPEAGAEA